MFFKREAIDEDVLVDTDLSTGDDDGPKIRCPKCRWEPKKSSRWFCTCGCSWNTFDTAGLCPDCGEQWEHTACLRCSQWSPHRAWYVEEDD